MVENIEDLKIGDWVLARGNIYEEDKIGKVIELSKSSTDFPHIIDLSTDNIKASRIWSKIIRKAYSYEIPEQFKQLDTVNDFSVFN